MCKLERWRCCDDLGRLQITAFLGIPVDIPLNKLRMTAAGCLSRNCKKLVVGSCVHVVAVLAELNDRNVQVHTVLERMQS